MSQPSTKRRGPLFWLASRTWRFWGAAFALIGVLYLGSFGPACWMVYRGWITRNQLAEVYAPIGEVAKLSPRLKQAMKWYVELWAPDE